MAGATRQGKATPALDDAAAAALYAIAHAPVEHMGAIYGEGLKRSKLVSSGETDRVKGALTIPGGASAIKALFHNHPLVKVNKHDNQRELFSEGDKGIARRLRVPSYISAGDRVRSFDPATGYTRDVLAQFPIDEWRADLMRRVLGRDPDDPRGALR